MNRRPVAIDALDEYRRHGAQFSEQRRGVLTPCQCGAQRRMYPIDDRNTNQKIRELRRQLCHQRLDEITADVPRTRGYSGQQLTRIRTRFQRGDGELQAERPAFAEVMESSACIGVEACTEACLQNCDRLSQRKAQ